MNTVQEGRKYAYSIKRPELFHNIKVMSIDQKKKKVFVIDHTVESSGKKEKFYLS